MKHGIDSIDLTQSCTLYSKSVQATLANLLNIQVEGQGAITTAAELERSEDIYFSILFTGQVYGEFVLAVNHASAMAMLGLTQDGEETRREIIDTFKELINIAAGTTLTHLRATFPDLSITPPRAVEGRLTLSKINMYKAALKHEAGPIVCYIYIDYMRLDIAETLHRGELRQEELRRLDRAKTEFLANMSHELRTPLNGMIGMLDLLKSSNLSATQRDQLEVIYKSGDFLLAIINDILEFSKIESGKLEIEKHEFGLRECIESVAESMATAVYAKNLEFNVFLDPSIGGRYLGDETRIKQVLLNLLGNAIKFTPTGHIGLNVYPGADGGVRMRVEDSGVGIPPSKLETIFESFSQADVSDNRKYGGSGLGLTISKSIVESMGGQISVESEEARGSAFSVDLPLARIGDRPARVNWPAGRVGLMSSNRHHLEVLKSYLPGLEVTPVDPLQSVPTLDYLVIETRVWDQLAPDVRRGLESAIRETGTYVCFLTRPHEIQAVVDLDQKAFGGRFYYLNAPLILERLTRVLRERPEIGAQATQEAATVASETQPAAAKKRILLVEDNDVNRTVAHFMISKMGYEIDIAVNGEEAVMKARASTYDIILMDCQMPVMNGYEATQALRALEAQTGAHVPIVAMTANAFRETKERCFECGMDDFVTKPIKMEALQDAIQRTFEKFSH